jgi:hypothetical protein
MTKLYTLECALLTIPTNNKRGAHVLFICTLCVHAGTRRREHTHIHIQCVPHTATHTALQDQATSLNIRGFQGQHTWCWEGWGQTLLVPGHEV